jgi:hypothetical protein
VAENVPAFFQNVPETAIVPESCRNARIALAAAIAPGVLVIDREQIVPAKNPAVRVIAGTIGATTSAIIGITTIIRGSGPASSVVIPPSATPISVTITRGPVTGGGPRFGWG